MKRILIIILALTAWALFAQNLPTCYYTYNQVMSMLESYETQYPNQAKVHIIGHSELDDLPIYAIRLTENVTVEQEKPSLLFIGQVHAEEVLGVQITMANIHEILTTNNPWLAQLDMWFIPTLNPEGHNVVTSNMDTSYRKNKRDNNNNGILDFSPLVGYDIDGVDINRNLSFNWVHGDTLMQPGSLEVYDYYRGPSPMSESEVQALKTLCDQRRFVYSIVWHSSRTGNLSEKLYYPFNWKDVRPSPDLTFFQTIGVGIASQIVTEAGGGTYQATPNLSRKGATHDWMYQQYGTAQMLIECATRNLQPDSLLMVDTVNRCSNGVRWLLNRALMYSTAVPTNSMLTGTVKDPSGNPLEAEIIIEERNAPWFRPRTSNPQNGRYWRAIGAGSYTLRVRKEGYVDYVGSVVVNGSAWTTRHVVLQPKATATFAGEIVSGGSQIPARIIFRDLEPDTILSPGTFLHPSFVGTYPIEVYAQGYYPYLGNITLEQGYNYYVIELQAANNIFSEDWENGTANWAITGPWVTQNELSVGGSAITDSWGGWGFYAQNADVNIRLLQNVSIPASTTTMMSFDSHLYTEWVHDPCTVEVSTDNGENWTAIWTKSGLWDSFRREYIDLSSYAGQTINLRFRLVDESINVELTDPGWTIDNIRIDSGSSSAVGNVDLTELPFTTILYPNYPNPFNPNTTIRFSLASSMPVKLQIFNQRGQLVKTLVDATMPEGTHSALWEGRDDGGRAVASGIYYYRLNGGGDQFTRRMVLIK